MAVKGLANMAQLGLANAVKSDYAKSKFKKTASKYLDQALDAFVNDMSKKIRGGGDYNAYDVNQILPMSMYAPGGVNDPTHPLYEGGAFDIHKAIGKLPKPKSGWTLPGHKYTGPYNDLDSQLRFDPKTGKILEIYDPPAGPSEAVAMQHDVDYSVCANKANPKKCKNEADRKMRRVIVNGIDEIWCSDLVEMQKFAKWNKGYRYLLMVLDIFSKYGWIVPLKNKKGESVAAGFKQIFAEGRVPKKMWTDKGSEYYNSHVKDLFKAKGVELYSTENEEKSSVCERWNRTIKTKMWKQFTIQNNTVYLDILPKILEKYNNTKHRSIGMTPVEASKKKNENAVYLKLYGEKLNAVDTYPPKFAVGDHVRISKFKRQLFDKGYTPNWSEEIFVVDEVQYTEPITYKLKDLLGEEIKGTFYEQEMLKAKQSLSDGWMSPKMDELETYTKAALLAKGKEMGVESLTGLNKKGLIEAIKNPAQHIAVHNCIMERHTVARLRQIAKENGLHGYANIRKDELIKRIKLAQSKPKSPPLPIITRKKVVKEALSAPTPSAPTTITELNELAKKQGIRGREYRKRLHEFIQSKKPQGSSTTPRGSRSKASLKKRDPQKPLFKAVEKMSSLKHFAKMYTIDGGPIALGPRDYLEFAKPTVIDFLNMLENNKIKFIFRCVMKKKVEGGYVFTIAHLSTLQKIVFQETDREELYEECVEKMMDSLEKFESSGSGWTFYQVDGLDLHTVKYAPLKGSSYIKLPKHLADKKAIINMENEDDECFKWCVTRALNPVEKNPTRITKILKKQAEKLVWGGISFPMEVKDIHRFEKLNPEIGVNVYMYKNGLNPLRVSSKGHVQDLIDLLLIQDGDKKHYCLIKNLSRLVSTQPNPEECYTEKKQQHIPVSFCYYLKCTFDDSYSKLVEYTAKSEDEDVAQTFVEALEDEVRGIYEDHPPKKMIFTKSDAVEFENATCCWLCGEDFEEGKDKVHARSLSLHRNLGVSEGDIDCIPNNEEKYISFTKHVVVDKFFEEDNRLVEVKRELRFIDSFKFMASSLDKLVGNLAKKGESFFQNTRNYYTGKKLNLLMRKGVYPYEWMDSIHKLDEQQLPPKEAFFSVLSGKGISDEDYTHAQDVWSVFGCKTFRDYHNLYNGSDVLLLADVFENFRKLCKKIYDLDPCWYFTAPGLAWDACLKLTEIELELLSDIDMLHMFEAGIRGGISMISTRHAKANNKYMKKKFDPTQLSKFIAYLDANNLYGWAMSMCLPTGGFEWVDEKNFEKWRDFPCILEVDLKGVKEELHDHFNDYPPAPENLLIGKVYKLTCTLNEKKKYIVHHEALKKYMSLGIEIGKIHRIIRFEERPWMKKYIDLNTSLRAKANNDFEKDFYKLMNNAVFGKTMENIRKRVDVRLVTREEKAKKLTNKVNFKHCTIFSEDLSAIHMGKTQILFNKPLYLGMSILDLSKTLMYDFHYNYIKPKYPEGRSKLLFTDTDSLCYEIQTEDFYKDITGDVDRWFDTSNISKEHPSGVPTGVNKKVIGKFKDEAGGKIIEEFVGLRAKLYSYKMFDDGTEKKKCKGVKGGVVDRTINFDDYKRCLFGGGKQLRTMNTLRSRKHEMYMEEINKVALSADDDKRIILPDKIHTHAIGHHKLVTQHT
ncbi:putative uncharacterized transposon-derived protein F54H12.3 [Stylophora pistillata]|uniref:Uncharacterized transposon-derived protein F54H12.3 n=1 Tax=Stylophora pistillata TaxID=50429 RepID=A0A2B4R7N4_STYPI|nr:putative uncharacterized transposon-derived protein F54H12.3 [Stylophora pistillata]